jgi:4-hydroxy-tetrahydrodipicolinate synthase
MAGAGTNDTRDAVELARGAQEAGADGILSVGPYYNKPTQEGLFRHFRAIAEAVDLPVIVYNVPTRTSSNILPSTILRLANEVENIAGVKEASGDMGQVMTLLRERPEGFLVLSGEDDLTYPMLSMGGDGIISVAANEIPGPMARMCDLAFAGRWPEALEIHWKVLPLLRANFLETNPIPVKTAMEMMGHFDTHFRLPLTPLSEEHREPLRRALEEAGALDRSAAGAS